MLLLLKYLCDDGDVAFFLLWRACLKQVWRFGFKEYVTSPFGSVTVTVPAHRSQSWCWTFFLFALRASERAWNRMLDWRWGGEIFWIRNLNSAHNRMSKDWCLMLDVLVRQDDKFAPQAHRHEWCPFEISCYEWNWCQKLSELFMPFMPFMLVRRDLENVYDTYQEWVSVQAVQITDT